MDSSNTTDVNVNGTQCQNVKGTADCDKTTIQTQPKGTRFEKPLQEQIDGGPLRDSGGIPARIIELSWCCTVWRQS